MWQNFKHMHVSCILLKLQQGNVLTNNDRMWVFGKFCHYLNMNYTILPMSFMYAWVHSLQSILASYYNHLFIVDFLWALNFELHIPYTSLSYREMIVVDKIFFSLHTHFFCHYRRCSLHNLCFKFYKKLNKYNLVGIIIRENSEKYRGVACYGRLYKKYLHIYN